MQQGTRVQSMQAQQDLVARTQFFLAGLSIENGNDRGTEVDAIPSDHKPRSSMSLKIAHQQLLVSTTLNRPCREGIDVTGSYLCRLLIGRWARYGPAKDQSLKFEQPGGVKHRHKVR